MNNPPISFDTLTRDHPQLADKALVDFINGLEVIDDHIRVREQKNSQFFSRIWGDLNGESALRQQTIDQHVTESLKTVSTWLQCLQSQQIQSDLGIAKVAEKLLETRKGVMLLLDKHNGLQQQVNNILISMDEMNIKYSQLSIKLEQVDKGRLASQHLEAVFDKWEVGDFNHYPVLIRLYLVFDELYWGDFGNYCRHCGLEHYEIKRLIEQVEHKSLIQLKKDWQYGSIFDWQAHIKNDLQQLSGEYLEVIAYLTNQACHEKMPILWSINQLANNPEMNGRVNNINIPIILNKENSIKRLIFDFSMRYNYE